MDCTVAEPSSLCFEMCNLSCSRVDLAGQPIDMTLIRTDVGCSDSQLHDKNTNWDPNGRTFFLNEIEYGGTTYFIRHLKEVPSCHDWP